MQPLCGKLRTGGEAEHGSINDSSESSAGMYVEAEFAAACSGQGVLRQTLAGTHPAGHG
jgi:hypothetical protein